MKPAKATFGEYFDNQRDKIVKDMQTGKNTELYIAWREDYDKRCKKREGRMDAQVFKRDT